MPPGKTRLRLAQAGAISRRSITAKIPRATCSLGPEMISITCPSRSMISTVLF